MKNILIIEDEKDLTELLVFNLEKEGFKMQWSYDGLEGLEAARSDPPDLIVLDLMLPGLDGLDVTRSLRRESDVPIIMLTARVDETDRLIGLELGADDYISKPFSPRELTARVRTVLRRAHGPQQSASLLRVSDLEIDLEGHRVLRGGVAVKLSRIEFNLLAILAQHPGQIFTRAQLLDRLHGVIFDGYDRSIDAHIKNLRRKLEPDAAEPRYVLTVYGIGYKFNEEQPPEQMT